MFHLIDWIILGGFLLLTTYVGHRLRGNNSETRYFTISGDIERKLWYAKNGILLRLALTAPDGSEVTYVLQ